MKHENTNTTTTPAWQVTKAPASTIATTATIEKEDNTMENNSAIVAPVAPVANVRRLNRAAARREALVFLRNAVINAAPAYAAALLRNAPAPAYDEVERAAAAYAFSLACVKDGEKIDYIAVPAALLIPAAVSLVCKGTRGEKRLVWDVKGLSFFKNVFTIDNVERSDKCTESTFTPSEKDYLKDKNNKSNKSQKPAWKTVYEGYSMEKKMAYQQYKAEKAIAKLQFDAVPANIDKKFSFIDFEAWFANRAA